MLAMDLCYIKRNYYELATVKHFMKIVSWFNTIWMAVKCRVKATYLNQLKITFLAAIFCGAGKTTEIENGELYKKIVQLKQHALQKVCSKIACHFRHSGLYIYIYIASKMFPVYEFLYAWIGLKSVEEKANSICKK